MQQFWRFVSLMRTDIQVQLGNKYPVLSRYSWVLNKRIYMLKFFRIFLSSQESISRFTLPAAWNAGPTMKNKQTSITELEVKRFSSFCSWKNVSNWYICMLWEIGISSRYISTYTIKFNMPQNLPFIVTASLLQKVLTIFFSLFSHLWFCSDHEHDSMHVLKIL